MTAHCNKAVLAIWERGGVVLGFHYEHAFTSETYQMMLEGLELAPVTVEVIPGRVPEGIAVLEKSV